MILNKNVHACMNCGCIYHDKSLHVFLPSHKYYQDQYDIIEIMYE